MKRIKLTRLVLNGYKSKKLDITFNDGDAKISGKNESGKSTTKNAFDWLLTGYDEFNIEKNNELFDSKKEYTYENSEPISVEGFFTIEEDEEVNVINLKRTASIGWIRKRGETEYTRKASNDYAYSINDAPVSATDYDNILDKYFPPQKYRRYSVNPNLFREYAKKDWKNARKDLEVIMGEIKDDELQGDYKDFYNFRNKNKDLSLDKLKSKLKENKKTLSESISEIPILIKGKQQELPDTSKVTQSKKELEALNIELEAINTQSESILTEQEKATLDNTYKRLAEYKQKLETLKAKYKQDLLDANSDDVDYHIVSEQMKKDFNQDVALNKERKDNHDIVKSQLDDKKRQLNKLNNDKGFYTQEIEVLRDSWTTTKNVQPMPKCPTCGKDLTDEAKDEYLEFFDKGKKDQLKQISKKAEGYKQNLEETTLEIEVCKERIEILESKINSYEESDFDADKERTAINEQITKENKAKQKAKDEREQPTPLEEIEEYQNLQYKIRVDQSEETSINEVARVRKEGINEQRRNLQEKIDEAKNEIRKEDTYNSIAKSIKDLNNQNKQTGIELANVELLENQINDYEREKAEITTLKVNEQFKYTAIAVTRQKKNGEWEDCCEVTTTNGVWGANKAQRGIMGADISYTFAHAFGIKMPLFVDEIEGINVLPEFDTQIITLETNHELMSIDNGTLIIK